MKLRASGRLISSVIKDLMMTGCAKKFPHRSHVGGAFCPQMTNTTLTVSLMIVTFYAVFILARVMQIFASFLLLQN